jgi:hypothetical protein
MKFMDRLDDLEEGQSAKRMHPPRGDSGGTGTLVDRMVRRPNFEGSLTKILEIKKKFDPILKRLPGFARQALRGFQASRPTFGRCPRQPHDFCAISSAESPTLVFRGGMC